MPMAVKILRPNVANDTLFMNQLRSEINTLSRLWHPNIVHYYGLEENAEHSFLVLDHVEGRPLYEVIHSFKDKTLPLKLAMKVFRLVCAALSHAHQGGWANGNINSKNIIINKEGQVFLSDFSRVWLSQSNQAGCSYEFLRTVYRAPEVNQGEDITQQADIYSLGILMYEMLSGGQYPYGGYQAAIGANLKEKIIWEQLNLTPCSLTSINPLVIAKMEQVVNRCLKCKIDQRFPCISDLILALQ
jgi:serine/threonine-protein kinase